MTKHTEITLLVLPLVLVVASVLYVSVLANNSTINTSDIGNKLFTSLINIKPGKDGLATISLNSSQGYSAGAYITQNQDIPLASSIYQTR